MRDLPDGELTVMAALWDCGGRAGAEEIASRLPEDRAWNRTTLLTMLSRLCAKHCVRTEKCGRTNIYTALISREEYVRNAGGGLISRLCSGSLNEFVRAMCDARGVSRDEIERLREYVNELSRKEDTHV